MRASLNKIGLLFLFSYIALVLYGQFFLDVSMEFELWAILVLFLVALILTIFLKRLYQLALQLDFNKIGSEKELVVWFVGVFVVTLGVLMLYYYAFFPGAFSPDSDSQLMQATEAMYSDWHPFIHTFLFFTIPMKIFAVEELIVFLQLLYFSFGQAYLIMTIRRYGCPRGLCIVGVCLVMLVPLTGNILMYPWKDCGLAIFSMVALAHYINIVITRGEWLKRKGNILACSISFALTLLVRHNAILFVLPMFVGCAIFGWKNRKQLILAIVVFSVMFLGVKVPMYKIFDVEKPGERTVETTGMCMTIMGNSVSNNPAVMDKEVLDFLYRVAPKEVWESDYSLEGFNSVKWSTGTDLNVIEEVGNKEVLKYTLKTIKTSKKYSLQAFLELTSMIWKLNGDYTWNIQASASKEKTEIVLNAQKQEKIAALLANWNEFVEKSILRYPANFIGWFNLVLIALVLCGIRKRNDLLQSIHAFPILCYNFGTALLLSGLDWRFFYITFPVIIPTIFLVIKSVKMEN